MRKVVVFDLDGTLIDSRKIYIDTIHNALLEHYLIYPKSHISRALGPKIEASLKNIGKFNDKTVKILKNTINRYIPEKTRKIKLTPYAKQALQKLKSNGYKIVLLTNSAKRFAVPVLKHQKIAKYFNKFYFAENFPKKEDAMKAIARKYKIKTKDIIYVADKMSDVKIARNVGCRIIITLAKSWDKNKLKGKKYSIASLKNLYEQLK